MGKSILIFDSQQHSTFSSQCMSHDQLIFTIPALLRVCVVVPTWDRRLNSRLNLKLSDLCSSTQTPSLSSGTTVPASALVGHCHVLGQLMIHCSRKRYNTLLRRSLVWGVVPTVSQINTFLGCDSNYYQQSDNSSSPLEFVYLGLRS